MGLNMDIKSAEDRSRNMSHIRSRDTSAEVYVRKLLFGRGFRYRIAPRELPGKPDLWFPGKRAAVFIHGCFWHRHEGCTLAYMPKSHVEFWRKKFADNVARDKFVCQQLSKQGIRRLVVWECTVRKMRKDSDLERSVTEKMISFLMGDLDYEEI